MGKAFVSILLAVGFAATGAVAHGLAGASANAQSGAPSPKAVQGTRDPRAYFTDTALLTQDGRTIRFYSEMLKDRVVVVNMMYTSCTEACPLITKRLNEVRKDLGELFGRKVFFVSISSDPERDTPRAMKEFAKGQGADVPGWTFLTGNKREVDAILKRFGALSENVESHATTLYILDVDRKRMRKMMPNLPAKAIAEAARIVAAPAL